MFALIGVSILVFGDKILQDLLVGTGSQSMRFITSLLLLAVLLDALVTNSDGTQKVMISVFIEDVNLITRVDETPVLSQDILVVGGIMKEIGDLNSKTYDVDLWIDETDSFPAPRERCNILQRESLLPKGTPFLLFTYSDNFK